MGREGIAQPDPNPPSRRSLARKSAGTRLGEDEEREKQDVELLTARHEEGVSTSASQDEGRSKLKAEVFEMLCDETNPQALIPAVNRFFQVRKSFYIVHAGL